MLGRVLLIASLLVAQASAISHELWHLRNGDLQGASAPAEPGKAAQSNPLCAQHQALDAVLGALHGQAALPLLADLAPIRDFPATLPARGKVVLSPSSRDPPALG